LNGLHADVSILIVGRIIERRLKRCPDKALMIVRRGIDQMTQKLPGRPSAGKGRIGTLLRGNGSKTRLGGIYDRQ
jgi:hypothetical protein